MKKIALFVCLISICSSVFAGTSVNWFFGWGMFPHGSPDTTSSPGVAALNDVTWQLVYAGSDMSINTVNAGNGLNGYVSGDDVVLETRTTLAGEVGSPTVADQWLFYYPDTFAPSAYESASIYSHVYIRVFQDTTPVIGEWYYNSAVFVTTDINITDPLRTSDKFDGNTDSAALHGDALNVQIVPEPSTMALALCGLGVLAFRRLRKE